MPRLPASVAAADPWRPLTAARPLPDDTQSTLPPRAATCAAKSVGTEPLNVTMRRLFVAAPRATAARSEEHTSELQSRLHLVCRLLLEKKKKKHKMNRYHYRKDEN